MHRIYFKSWKKEKARIEFMNFSQKCMGSVFFWGGCFTIYVCMYVYMYSHVHICVRVFMHVYVCVFMCVCFCVYICMYICVFIWVYICVFFPVCIYVLLLYIDPRSIKRCTCVNKPKKSGSRWMLRKNISRCPSGVGVSWDRNDKVRTSLQGCVSRRSPVEQLWPRCERSADMVKRRTWVNIAVPPCLHSSLKHNRTSPFRK